MAPYNAYSQVLGASTELEQCNLGTRKGPALPDPGHSISAFNADARLAGRGCCSSAYVVGIVGWNFCTSILLVNSVKFIYVRFDFCFPLFVACLHMLFSWALCAACLCFPQTHFERPLFTCAERVWRVAPFAVCGAATIACSNTALVFLYPSTHEMIQATTPFFALLTSVVFKVKSFNYWAYGAMFPLCCGAALTAAGDVNFSWTGTFLSVASVEFRVLRSLLQGWLLCDDKVDPISLCYYMAPFNVLLFGLGGAVLEGSAPLRQLAACQPRLIAALLLSSVFACTFNIATFLTIKYLDPVGSVVVLNAKIPSTILVSLVLFKNPVEMHQFLALFLTLLGIWLYGKKGSSEDFAKKIVKPGTRSRPMEIKSTLDET